MSHVNFSDSVDPDDVPRIHENPLEQEEAEMVDDVDGYRKKFPVLTDQKPIEFWERQIKGGSDGKVGKTEA